ncbi:MAG: hypothetical protein CVV64_16965, partial [Candidatus Wallbacteria bacterium HGW-Wallbacteria-1]
MNFNRIAQFQISFPAIFLILWIILPFMADPILAAAGDVDCNLGIFGKLTVDFNAKSDQGEGHAVYTGGAHSGKFVVCGSSFSGTNEYFGVARFLADGTLDTTFSGDGKVNTDIVGSTYDRPRGAMVLDDGSVFVCGSNSGGACVVKYTAAGVLDTTFSGDGIYTTTATYDLAAMATDSSGNIYVVGQASSNCIAIKLSSAGGELIVKTINTSASNEGLGAIANDGSDNFWAGGYSNDGASNKLLVVKLDTSLNFITSFDGDGIKQVTIRAAGHGFGDMKLDGSGKILIAGYVDGTPNRDFCVARLNTDGSFDTTLNTTGYVAVEMDGSSDELRGVAVQSDGKIVLTGHASGSVTNGFDFAIARLTSAGALDTTFDGDGRKFIDFGDDDRDYGGVNVLAGDVILVSGWSGSGDSRNFAVSRILPNDMTQVYCQARTDQVVQDVFPSYTKAVLMIRVGVNGDISPKTATSFSLNTTGTTLVSDITDAKLYYTGNSATFSSSTLYGTQSAPNGAFTITGSQTLVGEINHFWLAYTIASGAVADGSHVVDGQCTSITIGGSAETPVTTNPSGTNAIKTPYYPSITGDNNSFDYFTNVTFPPAGGINKTTAMETSGYADYTAFSANVSPGTSYNLTISLGAEVDPLYPQIIRAYFDWNRDFDFDDSNETYTLVTNNTTVGPHTYSIAVPGSATPGASRLRMVVDSNSVAPHSGTISYGEAEDYGIQILSSNTSPVLSIDDASLSYTENSIVKQIDSAAVITDADGDADWNGGTLEIQITASNEAADTIYIPDNLVGTINTSGTNLLNGATVIGTLSSAEGTVSNGTKLTITFNGNATNALIQQVVRGIHYYNGSDNPGTANRTVTLKATDKNAGTATDTRTIVITAVNDNPAVSSLPASVTVLEDTASDLNLSALSFTDADSGAGSVVLALTAGAGTMTASSGGSVTIGGSGTATLSLTGTAANIDTYLNTATNIKYTGASNANGAAATTLTLTANDGGNTGAGGGTDVSLGTVNVNITAVNDPPVITALGGDLATCHAGSGPVLLDQGSGAGANALVSDPDGAADFNGGNLTVTITAGGDSAEDILSLDTSATVTLSGTTAGSNVSVGGSIIGTLGNTIAAGSSLVINFTTANATPANVQTLIRSITYSNNDSSSPTLTSRTARVVLNDGDGTANGGNPVSTGQDITVVVVKALPAYSLLDNYDGMDGLSYTVIDGTPATSIWAVAAGVLEGQTGGVTGPEHSFASIDLSQTYSDWSLDKTKSPRWFGWMDLNRTDVSGWGASSYSCGRVLAANGSILNGSGVQGYAIGFRNSDDALALFRFSDGIHNPTVELPENATEIMATPYIYANGDNGVNFFVELMSDGKWRVSWKKGVQLSDGAAVNPANYTDGSAVTGAADETYTGTAFSHTGWVYAHNTGASDKCFVDNLGAGGNFNGWPVAGFNKTLDFDGTDDRVAITGPGAMSRITYSAWINPTNVTSLHTIVSKGSATGTCMATWPDASLGFRVSNIDWKYTDPADAISAGKWTHVACSFDPVADGGTIKMYVNGNLVKTYTATGGTIDAGTAMAIGSLVPTGMSQPYFGQIDEFRMYDEVISQANIQAWMHRKIDNTHPNYANLVAYYTFDSNSGSTLFDRRNSYNGTLTAMDGNTDWVDSSAGLHRIIQEDVSHVFSVSDFIFSDPDATALASVRVTSIPATGILWVDTDGSNTVNGAEAALINDAIVSSADISGGKLKYQPAANASGAPYTSFQFKVGDGTAYSKTAMTFSFDVTAVNDAPTGTNNTVTTNEDNEYTVTFANFGYSDIEGSAMTQVQITSLETAGALKLNSVDVTLNQVITKADIDAGKLKFSPA